MYLPKTSKPPSPLSRGLTFNQAKQAVLHIPGTNTQHGLAFFRVSLAVLRCLPPQLSKLPQPAPWTRAVPDANLSTIASTSETTSIASGASITSAGLLARNLASFQLKPSALQEIPSRRHRSLNVFTKPSTQNLHPRHADYMGSGRGPKHEWELPLPRAPISKPVWRRGQDSGDTAVRIPMPQEPPVHEVEIPVNGPTPSKRSFFKAFDSEEAQDAAFANRTVGYDHDLPQYPRHHAKKRRDSIQDDNSASTGSVSGARSPVSSSPLPTKPMPRAPAIVLTTESSTSSQDSAVAIPKELEIDGNAGFDPHRPDNGNTPPKRTYLYKGKRYEVQGDEPEEWLKDIREVAPTPVASRASVSSAQAGLHSRSSITPNSIRSGTTARIRQSRRESSDRPDDGDRRRSGRFR